MIYDHQPLENYMKTNFQSKIENLYLIIRIKAVRSYT